MKQYLIPALVGLAAGLLIERSFALTDKIPGVNAFPKA
jgi:hypothetical protein